MEKYIEQGEDLKDCELKIAAKYKRPFNIISKKEINIGGFLGFFSKPGVQVEFYFSPPLRSPLTESYKPYHQLQNIEALENEKRKVIAAALGAKQANEQTAFLNGKETSQAILDSLNELKMQLNGGKKEEHPAFVRVTELLKLNDFSDSYIEKMLERLQKELSFEQLKNHDLVQDQLILWIGESINIYNEETLPEYARRKPRIMVLVGPTGVGKTTTISKLAAIFGIGTDKIPAIDVRMITIDAFRIGAKEQLEKMGNIMRIPVCYVDNKDDLRREIALRAEDTDLFFIDTIGKSPKDASKLGEMKEILDGAGRSAEYHLVICAGTRCCDIEEIMRQFEPFNYKSVILTKMDETSRIGNIISALAEKRKSISYITDGQTVPVDIRRASVVHFLINLEGFKVNREKVEKHFPSGDADQFRWR